MTEHVSARRATSRRDVLKLLALGGTGALLASCTQAPAAAPAKPTTAPAKPAAAGTSAPAAKAQGGWPDVLVLTGYPEGSDSFAYNVGLARALQQGTPPRVEAKGLPGSAPILQALSARNTDLIAMNSYDASQARLGKMQGFEQNPLTDVVILTFLWAGDTGVGVRPNEGVDSYGDLSGKSVMLTSPFNPLFDASVAMAEHEGAQNMRLIPQTDVSTVRDGMINRQIAGFTWAMGAPFTLEIQQAVGLKWLPQPLETQRAGKERIPGILINQPVHPHIINLYGRENVPETSIAYPYTLMARRDMPDNQVVGILDAVFNGREFLQNAHYRGDQPVLERGAEPQAQIIPFHPASVTYFKERNVWTEENEAQQQALTSA